MRAACRYTTADYNCEGANDSAEITVRGSNLNTIIGQRAKIINVFTVSFCFLAQFGVRNIPVVDSRLKLLLSKCSLKDMILAIN